MAKNVSAAVLERLLKLFYRCPGLLSLFASPALLARSAMLSFRTWRGKNLVVSAIEDFY